MTISQDWSGLIELLDDVDLKALAEKSNTRTFMYIGYTNTNNVVYYVSCH